MEDTLFKIMFMLPMADLDEYNGRFPVNNDFPQGTYAYFATLDVNGNLSYPYYYKT